MLTYTSIELRALAGHVHPPPRAVRKTLFMFRLWRPRRLRVRFRPRPAVRAPIVDRPTNRSADSTVGTAVAVGWLNVQSLRNKVDAVNVAITDRSLDVFALTETWHTASDDNCLRLAAPPGYAVVEVARQSHRGGGVAIFFPPGVEVRQTAGSCV